MDDATFQERLRELMKEMIRTNRHRPNVDMVHVRGLVRRSVDDDYDDMLKSLARAKRQRRAQILRRERDWA